MDSRPPYSDEEDVYRAEGAQSGNRKPGDIASSGLENAETDDATLAAKLAHGQHDVMQILVERYQDHVFRIARRWLGDHGEAKDMVQQVFLEAFRDIAAFDSHRGSLKTWILTIAHNRTINRRQHLEAEGFYKASPLEEHFLDQATDLGQNSLGLLPAELSRLTTELMALLEPRECQVITLIYRRGLTREQVALTLGITVAAVKHSLKKGLKILYFAITESGKKRSPRNDGKGKDTSVD